MSVPVDQMLAQIAQQYGLMGQPQGGLMGGINQALAPYGGAMNAGLAMLGNTSGATAPMASLAQGLQNAQAIKQRNDAQSIQNMQGVLQLQQAAQQQQFLKQALAGGEAGAGQTPPQGQPSPQATGQASQAPQQFAGFQQGDISQIPINGIPARTAYALALSRGEDPTKAAQAIRTQQLQIAQQRAKPLMDALDTLIQSPYDPTSAIKNNPMLKQAWEAGARLANLDPNDFSDVAKIRFGLAAGRNQLAGNIGLGTIQAPVQQEQIEGPLGQRLSKDPRTGEIKQEVAPQETAQFITPQGVRMMTKAAGMAAGYEPFNPTTLIQSQMKGTGGDLIASLAQHGVPLPSGMSRSPQAQVALADKIMARNPGKSADEVAEMMRTGQLDFNGAKRSTGQLATMSAAADTQMRKLEKDFASLDPLVAKLPDAPAKINAALTNLKNNWSFGGDKESAALVGWLKESAGEYAKLISGAYGAAGAGEGNLKDAISQFQTAFTEGGYEGLKSVIVQSGQHRRDSVREGLQAASKAGAAVGASDNPNSDKPKVMPGGSKLQAYATAHFGGDIAKASAYLKSQGYQ